MKTNNLHQIMDKKQTSNLRTIVMVKEKLGWGGGLTGVEVGGGETGGRCQPVRGKGRRERKVFLFFIFSYIYLFYSSSEIIKSRDKYKVKHTHYKLIILREY